jgi:hypothetical protein
VKFSKSVIDRLIFADVDYLGKAEYGRHKGKPVVQEKAHHGLNATSTHRGKEYAYDKNKGEINVHREVETAPRKKLKTIPANAAHEKELKNASYSLDFSKSVLENMGLIKSEKNVIGTSYKTSAPHGSYDLKSPPPKKEKAPPRAAKYAESNARDTDKDEELDANFEKHAPSNKSMFNKSASKEIEQDIDGKGTDTDVFTKEDGFLVPPAKTYRNRPKTGDVEVFESNMEGGKKNRKVIPANAAHEKELKNASVFSVFDEILEKGRRGKNKAALGDRKKFEESEGEGVELPGGSMATMGNPGGSKEKASFERAEPGTIRNLKKLAESKDPSDRKASEAGLKRH